jgi:hypothetical protein
MFATVVVVLPASFEGGDAHLSHGNQSLVFNTSVDSLLNTSVLAWYTDVMHEIKPITAGYRLALSYNLIHTTSSLRPALPTTEHVISPLRRVLLSWKQQQKGPEKIIYMLDHQYSHANMSGGALKGSDAHTLAILDELAKEMGFHLGLANLEHKVTGTAADDGGYHDYGEVSMQDVDDTTTSIEHLVDLDGKLISDDIDFDDETETIPRNLGKILEEGGWDDQEYEGYQGEFHLTLSSWLSSHCNDRECELSRKPFGLC